MSCLSTQDLLGHAREVSCTSRPVASLLLSQASQQSSDSTASSKEQIAYHCSVTAACSDVNSNVSQPESTSSLNCLEKCLSILAPHNDTAVQVARALISKQWRRPPELAARCDVLNVNALQYQACGQGNHHGSQALNGACATPTNRPGQTDSAFLSALAKPHVPVCQGCASQLYSSLCSCQTSITCGYTQLGSCLSETEKQWHPTQEASRGTSPPRQRPHTLPCSPAQQVHTHQQHHLQQFLAQQQQLWQSGRDRGTRTTDTRSILHTDMPKRRLELPAAEEPWQQAGVTRHNQSGRADSNGPEQQYTQLPQEVGGSAIVLALEEGREEPVGAPPTHSQHTDAMAAMVPIDSGSDMRPSQVPPSASAAANSTGRATRSKTVAKALGSPQHPHAGLSATQREAMAGQHTSSSNDQDTTSLLSGASPTAVLGQAAQGRAGPSNGPPSGHGSQPAEGGASAFGALMAGARALGAQGSQGPQPKQSRARYTEGKDGWHCLDDGASAVGYWRALMGDLADSLFHNMINDIVWEEREIRFMGKYVKQPRLVAYYAESASMQYTYAGLTLTPRLFSECPALAPFRQIAEKHAGCTFNSVLLNYYRTGTDYAAWHADNEKVYGSTPTIASVSIGASREFVLRYNTDHSQQIRYTLGSGDLLIMRGALQQHWQHTIKKTMRVKEPRINLTFRQLLFPEKPKVPPKQAAKPQPQRPQQVAGMAAGGAAASLVSGAAAAVASAAIAGGKSMGSKAPAVRK